MASSYFIADSDGTSNKVYFDVDPMPIPTLERVRIVAEQPLLPSKNASGDYVAGGSKITDMGASMVGGRFHIFIPYMSDSNLDSLLSKYQNTIKQVSFYHADDGVTYLCVFDSGNSLRYTRPEGIGTSWYEVEITLVVVGTV